MKRIMWMAGVALLLTAGTATAQTSVELSVGFGAPRPYVSGYVIVGRPYMRPVYRPYVYRRYHRHHYYGPRVIVVERGRYYRGHRNHHRHYHDGD